MGGGIGKGSPSSLEKKIEVLVTCRKQSKPLPSFVVSSDGPIFLAQMVHILLNL